MHRCHFKNFEAKTVGNSVQQLTTKISAPKNHRFVVKLTGNKGAG